MRLICPNCGAQYEVADDVIPQDGRDVQCSNCAHTWFENHGASEAEDTPPQDVDPALDDIEDDDGAWGAEDYAAKPEIAEKTAPKRQELDPAIADILREEAAREAAARRAEAEIEMQSQPDLGLDTADAAPDQRSVEAQRRMALLKGDETVNAPVMAPSAGSRSELLPDIEEINSSLRSESERGTGYAEPEEVVKQKKRGFRAGFFGVMLILAILAALYIFAPQIIKLVPATEGALTAYVDTVDAGRLWLDMKMRGMIDAMNAGDTAEAMAAPEDAPAPAVSTQAPALDPITE